MKIRHTAALLACIALGGRLALGDDPPKAKSDEKAKPSARVLVFGDGAARFRMTRDRRAGTITLVSEDPALRLGSAPVLRLKTGGSTTPATLVEVKDQPGTWRLTHTALLKDPLDGTMEIVVAGQTYSSPIVFDATDEHAWIARHGGQVIEFTDCPAHLEIVQDASAGRLTIYPFDDTPLVEAPVLTLTGDAAASSLTVTKVDGEPGVWMVSDPAFKTSTAVANMRIQLNGSPCEVPLSFTAHGGRIVTVEGGPRFEIVRDETTRTYTFYAIDDKVDGKTYVIENPQVVYTTPNGPKTVVLTPVEREPRSWRLIGFGAGVSSPADAHLRFTLFGKTLSTDVGLSGFGVDVR